MNYMLEKSTLGLTALLLCFKNPGQHLVVILTTLDSILSKSRPVGSVSISVALLMTTCT